jgi:16S rRNA (guanine527-N7)-methyltransferase
LSVSHLGLSEQMASKSRRASLVLTSIAVVMFSLFGKGYSFFHSSIKHGVSSSYLLKFQSRRYLSSETTSNWQPDFSPYKKDFDSISEEQWDKLEELSLKLFDWNTKVNLVSRKDVEFLIPNHVIPCLSMSLIRNFKKGETVIDVGTGGGLPGLPLAIICPDAQFTLIDSNSKKMMVVNDMAASLGLKNVRVICCRAEKLTEKFDFLLGRAVSALPNFLSFSSHLIKEKSAASSTTIANTGITVSSGMLYLKGDVIF